MRLLRTSDLSLVEFNGNTPRQYAVLSHVWRDTEVKYDDIVNGVPDGAARSKQMFRKLDFCQKQATQDGLDFFWVDTCCIDRSRSSEISEAVNSMFDWYCKAAKCYVYMDDVGWFTPTKTETAERHIPLQFQKSKWFTRSWTLPELLAPASVEFFTMGGVSIGSKASLLHEIHRITGIPEDTLQARRIRKHTFVECIEWAAWRTASREEDEIYSLLGILDVHMPIMYGEGKLRAIVRLERQLAEYPVPQQVPQYQGHAPVYDKPRTIPTQPTYYRTLAKNGFRVFTLDPGETESPITGRIEEHSLEMPPPYNALSYVWGQESTSYEVMINNEITNVKANLFYALRRLRALQSVPTRLWVDSLCIDQRNDTEKTIQVQQMADIFAKADGVFIWLGEEDSTSKTAMELVAEIYEQRFHWSGSWWELLRFSALGELLDRPWFRRSWILQEAAFSACSTIQCGDRQMYMDHFSMAMDSIRARIHSEPRSVVSTIQESRTGHIYNFLDSPAIRTLDMIEGAFVRSETGIIEEHTMSLEMLVHLGTFSETTDKRDTIFALLNVANDTENSLEGTTTHTIVPDYKKSVLDVYVDFIMHCCRQAQSLDIIVRPWAPPPTHQDIGQFQVNKNGSYSQTFPSWISTRDKLPYGDPTSRLVHRIHGIPLVGSSEKRVYNADDKLPPAANMLNNGSLRTKGVYLARVAQTSSEMTNATLTKECLELLGKISRKPRSGLINLPDSIWRTLCADRDERGDAAPRSYRVAMLDLLHLHFKDAAANTSANLLEHMSSIEIEQILKTDIPEHLRKYLTVVRDVIWNRRTFHAEGKDPLVGLIPQNARAGDEICILYGCSVPVVLREHKDADEKVFWELIGDAYAHAFMDGKVLRHNSRDDIEKWEMEFEIR